MIVALAVADGDGFGLGLAVAQHEHIGDFLHLCLPDLKADLLVAQVQLRPEVFAQAAWPCSSLAASSLRLVMVMYLHLYRRQPCGERAAELLGQDADKAFQRSVHHAVDHHRAVFFAVRRRYR